MKRGRYKNMILKVTPVLTKVNLIKGLSFEGGCIDQSSLILNKKAKLNDLRRNKK